MSQFVVFPYRFTGFMQTCIPVNRYVSLRHRMRSEPLWVTNVRLLRTARGWSQGELAAKAHVQPNTLSAALNQQSSPNLSTLEKLVGPDALNVPIWRLFVDERQADVLNRQEAADAALANESEIAARIERRLMEKMGGIMRDSITEEMRAAAQPARPVAVPTPKRRKVGR